MYKNSKSRLQLLQESAERSAKRLEEEKEEVIDNYLAHHGILGMKWGVRRYQPYPKGHNQLKEGGRFTGKPTSKKVKGVRARVAQRKNIKVDKGFDKWKEGAANRDKAIETGKKRNAAKLEADRKKTAANKERFKELDKQYKKELKSNTTYRKGQVRSEVGKDLSRKFLSEAKSLEKEIIKDPSNKALVNRHAKLMGEYNRERSKARRAVEVAQKRSRKIATLKAARTKTLKGAMTAGLIAAGAVGVNEILRRTGKQQIGKDTIRDMAAAGKKLLRFAGYFY